MCKTFAFSSVGKYTFYKSCLLFNTEVNVLCIYIPVCNTVSVEYVYVGGRMTLWSVWTSGYCHQGIYSDLPVTWHLHLEAGYQLRGPWPRIPSPYNLVSVFIRHLMGKSELSHFNHLAWDLHKNIKLFSNCVAQHLGTMNNFRYV